MKNDFGKNKKGEETSLFILENENFRLSLSDYGATIVSWIYKPKSLELVAGFDNVENYVNHTAHFGSMIGRVANRIKDAKFTLNCKEYHVTANKGGNSLHGGENGFDKRLFMGEETADNQIVFTALSEDGDEGYPGNLEVEIIYTLLEDGIRIDTSGTADADTLFGITNHSYFNLNGKGSVLGHVIEIPADVYAPNLEDGTADGTYVECAGTTFDFTEPKVLEKALDTDDAQVVMTQGFDHHFNIPGEGMRKMGSAQANGLKLVVRSDLPGVHFYTGNFLNGNYTGHNGVNYGRQERFCFEPEFYPNAINYEGLKQPILKANKKETQSIEYLLFEE